MTEGGLLLILAHPDDESFAWAGAACSLAERGIATSLVCATRGQAGKAGDPPVVPREALPAAREHELRAACDVLGIDLVAVLDYEDQHLAEAPVERMRGELVRAIRAVRPRLVGSFDTNGVNGHVDHIAIARFAIDAVAAAADPRWFPEHGVAHRVERLVWSSPVIPYREWRPPVLARTPGVDIILDVARFADRKAAALRAHRSQHQSVDRCWFSNGDPTPMLSVETFRVGGGAVVRHRPVDDLFAELPSPD